VAGGLDFAAMAIDLGSRFHEHLHDWPRGDSRGAFSCSKRFALKYRRLFAKPARPGVAKRTH
jgi:hypothetical protein